MGNDIDDALAMSLLHSLQTQGEAELLAVTVSKEHRFAPVLVDIINHFYGRPDIPIGMVKGGVTPEDKTFLCPVCEAKKTDGTPLFPRRLHNALEAERAVTLLRRTLARAQDQSVVAVMIGFATNFAHLFDSGPDEISPLTGLELVARKIKWFSIMAGNFSPEVIAAPEKYDREYNVHMDIASSIAFYKRCPRPIVFSGFELGDSIRYPVDSILSDFNWCEHHPVAMGYRLYKPMPYDRPCWDPTAILNAVRPDGGYFGLSPKGCIEVTNDGCLHFKESPLGMHRYLTVSSSQRKRILGVFLAHCPYNPNSVHAAAVGL